MITTIINIGIWVDAYQETRGGKKGEEGQNKKQKSKTNKKTPNQNKNKQKTPKLKQKQKDWANL